MGNNGHGIQERLNRSRDSEGCCIQRKYGVQMLMRIEEIHKFSNGTLQQVEEALDLRIKEYLIRHAKAGEHTMYWTKKDFERNKQFLHAIRKLLKERRIFQSLESFISGRIREGDYRLLQRTI